MFGRCAGTLHCGPVVPAYTRLVDWRPSARVWRRRCCSLEPCYEEDTGHAISYGIDHIRRRLLAYHDLAIPRHMESVPAGYVVLDDGGLRADSLRQRPTREKRGCTKMRVAVFLVKHVFSLDDERYTDIGGYDQPLHQTKKPRLSLIFSSS